MSLRFKGADLRPVLTEAIANQCRIVLVKDQGVYFPRRAWGSVARMDASNCSPTPSAATRTPTRSMTGGTSPAASWVATILRSISTRRTACSRASCTRRTISCCPPPPRTCPWPWCLPPEAATAAQPSQPPHRGFLCSHRGHRRACAFVSSRQGTPRGHSAGMPPETTA